MTGQSPAWRLRVGRSWRRYQWVIVAAGAITGVVLGFIGLRQNQPRISTTDAIYGDLQLWIGQAQSPVHSTALNVARFLVPAVAGYSTLAAASVLLRNRILATRASFAKNHIVVAGCGQTGLGFVLSARRMGRAVTVVDCDPTNPLIRTCNQAGVHVVVGDATDVDALGQARIDHAADLVIVCPDDDVNTTIALQAMSRPLRHRLRIAARVRDPAIAQVLRAYQLHCDDRRVVLEVFDLDQVAAPLLLDHVAGGDNGRLALVGDHPMFAHVLRELAAREAARFEGSPGFDSVVLVADPEPPWLAAALSGSGPRPAFSHMALAPRLAALSPPDALRTATVALVTANGDGHTMATALMLHEAAPAAVRVVACLSRTPDPTHVAQLPDIDIFDVIAGVCTPELLDQALIETLARAIHERYLVARGPQPPGQDEESLRPWATLPTGLKDSNRDQAAHIGTKLRTIGCGVVPLSLGPDLTFEFTAEEVETLSRLEHVRWVEERTAQGWTPGPRDIAAKKTPYLVAWEELSPEIQDRDRETVRNIPELLARVGYGIVRASHPV